jgi:hypothetical protein
MRILRSHRRVELILRRSITSYAETIEDSSSNITYHGGMDYVRRPMFNNGTAAHWYVKDTLFLNYYAKPLQDKKQQPSQCVRQHQLLRCVLGT